MNDNKQKISTLIAGFNSALSVLKGQKFKNMGAFHDTVSRTLEPLLTPLDMEYGSWHIRAAQETPLYEQLDINDLFTLHIPGFIEDKRIKMGRSGRIVDIFIKTNIEANQDITLDEYTTSVRIKIIRDNLTRINSELDSLNKQIKSTREAKFSLETDLNNLLTKNNQPQ